jgi:hypothetical protein
LSRGGDETEKSGNFRHYFCNDENAERGIDGNSGMKFELKL